MEGSSFSSDSWEQDNPSAAEVQNFNSDELSEASSERETGAENGVISQEMPLYIDVPADEKQQPTIESIFEAANRKNDR